jgi:hypothetical protein
MNPASFGNGVQLNATMDPELEPSFQHFNASRPQKLASAAWNPTAAALLTTIRSLHMACSSSGVGRTLMMAAVLRLN